jgi:hypothetical protein
LIEIKENMPYPRIVISGVLTTSGKRAGMNFAEDDGVLEKA